MTFDKINSLDTTQIADLHALYQNEWWTKDRTLADTRRMLQHCTLIVGFCETESKKLAAFSRILTDYLYKAFIFDVIVAEPYRHTGLGRRLVDAIVHHPDLQNVKHLELYCLPEMVPFYRKWGFTDELGELCLMRKTP